MGVVNSILFIGQKILGGTLGAPLSTSASGLLVSGISTSTVNATANTTTTSTTNVLISSMTLTPAAGTYYVSFHTSLQENANNAIVTASLFSGGVQITGTEMPVTPFIQGGLTPSLPLQIPISISAFATVNGAQAIEARWRVSAGTGTATQRILNIVRVA